MKGTVVIGGAKGPALENFVAELTDAAYSVALRHGAGQSWVELELGLWEALAETVRKNVRSHFSLRGEYERQRA
jgi:hypothetical protein